MICPACSYENMPGQDECAKCMASLQQEDVPQPDTPTRWRIMVDPISSLEPSTVEVQVVAAGASLEAAIRQMQEQNVGYVLVTDPAGKLTGIFTEHDLLCKVIGEVSDLNAATVDQYMTPNPTTLKLTEPIKHALHFMAINQFMYIPLVNDDDQPIGMLSFRRIARLLEHME